MTDPLIEIAEALEREADHIDSLNTEYIGEFDRVLAARISAWVEANKRPADEGPVVLNDPPMSPQRRAFMEASRRFAAHVLDLNDPSTESYIYGEALLQAYRSMVESERGESGR